MRREAGVYALVMQLDTERTMSIDRKGTRETYLPGWYVYVGSARGSGGLKARTDRHQKRRKDGKRMHWNVDYFREYASIREIWYSYTDSAQWEHTWAQTMMKMHGAASPTRKFGAEDCDSACDSHFIRFPRRPLTIGFRSILKQLTHQPPHVWAEFHDKPRSSSVEQSDSFHSYDQGRRFLEQRRLAIESSELSAVIWSSLAKGKPARGLMEQFAEEMFVPFETLKSSSQFAEAVEELVRNCGEVTIPVLFDVDRPQSRKAIMQLSRTADTRQRYRIDGVWRGEFRSIAPQDSDRVFDTVAFKEVISRLARARGAIEKLQRKLSKCRDTEIIAESVRLADLCCRAARRLQKFINAEKVTEEDIPKNLTTDRVWDRLMSRDVTGDIVGLARLALRLTIKSVWDYPEMRRRGLMPTDREREKAMGEIREILSTGMSIRPGKTRKGG